MNKDITPRNKKGERHGLWKVYFGDKLMYEAFYHNAELLGHSELYNTSDNTLTEKIYHI
jgi:antitoxin component YwqK of YwqJK toxin-antitoxin module